MNAAIVKFDALANPIRAAPQNDYFFSIRDVGFRLARLNTVAFIGGIHIRRHRGKFGCAGIDSLVDRYHVHCATAQRHLGAGQSSQFTETFIREAHFLIPQNIELLLR